MSETEKLTVGALATVLLLFNGHHETVGFTLPPTVDGDEWHLLLNTSNDAQKIGKVLLPGDNVTMELRSLVAFVMQRADNPLPNKDANK